VVHSMVEFADRSVKAQLGTPDMRLPIQYALAYPDRLPSPAPSLDLLAVGRLTFEALDRQRFPCPDLAYEAGRLGMTYPAVLNAANEVAVAEFLGRRLNFTGISALVAATLEGALYRNWTAEPTSVDDALMIDHDTRLLARELLPEIAAMAS